MNLISKTQRRFCKSQEEQTTIRGVALCSQVIEDYKESSRQRLVYNFIEQQNFYACRFKIKWKGNPSTNEIAKAKSFSKHDEGNTEALFDGDQYFSGIV